MEDMDSSFLIYHQGEHELRLELVEAKLELETTKNLLKRAYQERDEAKLQLQNLLNKLTPSSATNLENTFIPIDQENIQFFPSTKVNSSITESNSFSLGSPQVESLPLFDTVFSPEFSNNNNMDCYLNQNLVQEFSSEKSMFDRANVVIDCIAKQRVLPQKGELLQAVMNVGPLLHTFLLADPLPNWKNPPFMKEIKVPPLTFKDYNTPIASNTFSDSGNLFLKPKIGSFYSSTAPNSSCSPSMLNFAGNNPSILNNA